ncbi:MAG: pyridoxamine 5'-phosphate oxidase family protein [Litorilinea sp.]
MTPQFSEILTTAQEIRDVLGEPGQRVLDKVIPRLDRHCQEFIAASPFMLIASCDAQGQMDVSPKGDPAGFVQVLDETTLAIPDRVGNRRADTLINLINNPRIGLLFLAPGKQETLRVNGRAQVVRDGWLREQMAVRGKAPDLAIVVTVEEAFLHCAKCMIRSELWNPAAWPNVSSLASIAQVMVDHSQTTETVESLAAQVAESYRDRLY